MLTLSEVFRVINAVLESKVVEVIVSDMATATALIEEATQVGVVCHIIEGEPGNMEASTNGVLYRVIETQQ